jgi:hypothetical protein
MKKHKNYNRKIFVLRLDYATLHLFMNTVITCIVSAALWLEWNRSVSPLQWVNISTGTESVTEPTMQ